MKRITALILSIMMFVSVLPVQALAQGTLVHDYGEISITIPMSEEFAALAALEEEFRRYVLEQARAYAVYHEDVNAFYKYYYEAADIKHQFDSEFLNKDLPYNTAVEADGQEYQQQTREIILLMLSQNIQSKESEMRALTPQEREAYFPGIVYDPTSGEWRVNEEPILAQTLYDQEVDYEIQAEADKALELCINAEIDLILGIVAGSKGGMAYSANDVITDAVHAIWASWQKIEFLEEKKYYKNMYRAAMIEEVMAAQKNVNAQMFSGLTEMEAQLLERKDRLNPDEVILLEVLSGLLEVMRDEGVQESEVLSTTIQVSSGSLTIDQAIEIAAQELVDEMGMPEQIPLSWQERKNEMVMSVIKESIRACLKLILNKLDPDVGALIMGEIGIDALVDEAFEKLMSYDGVMDTDGDGAVSCEELTAWMLEAENKTKVLESLFELVSQKIVDDNLAMSHASLINEVSEYVKAHPSSLKPENGASYAATYKILEKLNKVNYWEKLKNESGFIGALIGNAVALGESGLNGLMKTASLKNVVENEVYYSYISSQMYRSKQFAQETRIEVAVASNQYADWEIVQNASLEDLKAYIDQLYVVYNTDLLGQAYYTSMAMGYAWETDYIERGKQHSIEANEWMLQAAKNAWDEAGIVGIGAYLITWPIGGVAASISAVAMTNGVPDYLKRVEEVSQLGSWLDEQTCMAVYNAIGGYMENAEIPEKYMTLFEQEK